MGGRGGKGGFQSARAQQATSTTSTIQQQAPTASNTPLNTHILQDMQDMDDSQLAKLVRDSKGIDMPNFLNDIRDETQEFVYSIGLNDKPQVMDDAAFDKYLQDNNIRNNEILARSVDPITYRNASNTRVSMTTDDVSDMLKYSKLNYIGGKHGGQVYGAGTYFEQNGGHNTGYGSQTITGVLSKDAKVITRSALRSQAASFANSHPQFAQAAGRYNSSNASIYALAMGYNVISSGSGYGNYYNVIDRSVLVLRKDDR